MAKHITTRLYFLELLAYWEGRVTAGAIAEQFGLSRQQGQATVNEYQLLAPDNLIYDSSIKAHVPTPTFTCVATGGRVDEYLHWLKTGQLQPVIVAGVEVLALPSRCISAPVMRALVAAIKGQLRVDVDYVSLSNPNDEGRIIVPHSFVNTGLRWHLRAYCEKSSQYRDFVLSRFRGIPELLDKSPQSAAQDVGWITQVAVKFKADSRLNDQKRAVIEQDYQMVNGELVINTRGCLVNYLLQELKINTKILDGTPEAQQLMCVNLSDIKPWLFDS